MSLSKQINKICSQGWKMNAICYIQGKQLIFVNEFIFGKFLLYTRISFQTLLIAYYSSGRGEVNE